MDVAWERVAFVRDGRSDAQSLVRPAAYVNSEPLEYVQSVITHTYTLGVILSKSHTSEMRLLCHKYRLHVFREQHIPEEHLTSGRRWVFLKELEGSATAK